MKISCVSTGNRVDGRPIRASLPPSFAQSSVGASFLMHGRPGRRSASTKCNKKAVVRPAPLPRSRPFPVPHFPVNMYCFSWPRGLASLHAWPGCVKTMKVNLNWPKVHPAFSPTMATRWTITQVLYSSKVILRTLLGYRTCGKYLLTESYCREFSSL